MGIVYRVKSALGSWLMAVRRLSAPKLNRRLQPMLATVLMAAAISCASQQAHADRAETKRKPNPSVVDQSGASQRVTSNPGLRSRRGTGESSTFRAEDIVPDICKGCSS